MTRIDPHREFAIRLRESVRTAQGGAAQARGAASGAAASAAARDALLQRIAALDPADPDRPRKAVRLLIESELAREFGGSVLGDGAFGTMVDTVQQQMGEDVDLAEAMRALGDWLVRQQPAR